jgi:uncharacterized delta-60 repeat protein
MRLRRTLLLIFVLFSMLNATTQCVGPDAAMGGAMSCNPLNGVDQSATITYEDTEAYGMDSISIPVTIAKNTDGIDATSVSFQEAALTPQLSAPKYLGKGANPKNNAIVGTFFFHRVNNKCGKILVINSKGQTTDILTPKPTQNCRFTLQFKASLIGKNVALVATDADEIVDGIQASAPIFLKVNPPHPLLPNHTFNVFITGVDSDMWNAANITFSDESVHAMVEVQDRGMAFLNIDKDDGKSPKSEVVFPVIEDGEQTALWSLPAVGGYPEPFIETNVLSQSMVSSPYELHFFDDDQTFYQVNGLADVIEIDLHTQLKSPTFKIHPSGEYILYNARRENPYTGKNSIIPVVYFVDKDEHIDIILEDLDINFVTLDFDWMNQYTIIISGKGDDDQYYLLRANLELILDGYDYAVEDYKELDRTATYMGNPTSRDEFIYYHCEDEDTGINNICEANIITENIRTLIDVGLNLSSFFRLSNDELSYIAFQTNPYQAGGALPPVIGMFDLVDEETFFITLGHAPLPSNFNLDIVAYRYSLAPDEPFQVGIINLNNDLIKTPEELSVYTPELYVGQRSNTAIRGVGGRPPYKFQLKSGIGHVNTYTGSYRSPGQAGTAVVTVRDSEENTADAIIHIAGHGEPDVTFNNDQGTAVLDLRGQAQKAKMVNGGAILVAGTTDSNELFISKFSSTGNIDSSFGDELGYTKTSIGMVNSRQLTGMLNFGTGKTIIGGFARINNSGMITDDGFLARYNIDGSLDETFGDDGIVAYDVIGTDNRLLAMTKQGSKIIGVGSVSLGADESLTIARFTANGVLDPTFGNEDDETRIINFTVGALEKATAVAIQSDQKIIVAGYVIIAGVKRLILVRLTTNGNIDTSFGNNGKVLTTVPNHSSIISEIKIYKNLIYVCGTANHNTTGTKRMLLARYRLTGNLDSTFGTNGLVIWEPIAGGNADANSLSIQSDGKIVVGGASRVSLPGVDFINYRVIQQFKSNGQFDFNFGEDSMVAFDTVDATKNGVNNIYIMPDKRIIYSGWLLNPNSGNSVPAVGRIWY